MKTTRFSIIAALAIAIASLVASCTHNNGDIGPWFGTWHVGKMAVDGIDNPNFPDSVFFQFQSSVFCMRRIYPHQQYYAAFGTWEDLGNNSLRIVFPDTAMRPIAEVGLDSATTLKVEQLSSRRAVLSTVPTDSSSHKIRYTLRYLP